MHKLAIALAAAVALATPVLAQKPEEPKKADEAKKPEDAKKLTAPPNTFFKGQTSAQVLAKDRLLGAKVLDKDNKPLGTVEDLIVSGTQLEGIILAVGDKKIGIRIGALKITTVDGNATIVMPAGSPDILKAVAAYQRGTPAKK
jgi:hypothetical protein